jgi:energy-coupling factor transporter ATP-binding protein EcfA2
MSSNIPIQSISVGRIQRPQKTVIYGPEGVGKSTLASQFPAPVFLDTEGGTHHLDVVRFTEASNWELIAAAIAQLASGQHEFKTLVIDTADWLEKRLAEAICRKTNKDSIEDFGYGKGYILLAEEFSKFLASLDGLLRKGMHVVLLAHSTVRKFESPDQAGSYDRYELKLSKQVGPLLKEWADLILFANYVTRVAESDSGKRRGVGGKERVLFTTHAAAYDAKNRHGLEDKLPFAFSSIASVFAGTSAVTKAAPVPEQTLAERLAALFSGREEAVRTFLVSRGQIKASGSWADIAPDYATRVLQQPERFIHSVDQFVAGGAQ